jgi:hypothetical protein
MKTVEEIETAIERLPDPQVAEIAAWLERFRMQRSTQKPQVEAWLQRARGGARPRVKTADVMSLSRGEE